MRLGKNVTVGHGSCIGFGDPNDGEILINDNVTIGAFCVIYFGVTLCEEVFIDDYSKVCSGSKIGKSSKLLYGKHVYDSATIGENCIIGGHVADRTIIEDNVTYLGEIAHSHRHANVDWDETEEISPIIMRGSFIGLNCLIIGPRQIGPCAYVGAGEIIRTDVGKSMGFISGRMKPLSSYRGMFKSRCDEHEL
ncbi:MAG: hypothetical protein ABI378_09365 [Chitinophagaceae bacterium]